MSPVNFHGNPNVTKVVKPEAKEIARDVKSAIPDLKGIANDTKGMKSFPELCEQAKKEAPKEVNLYTSPYGVYESPKTTAANKVLSAQAAQSAYQKPSVPYN